jgi:hypothetical protein
VWVKWYTDYRYGAAQVREAILTSALLRLPKTMSRAHKEARVDEILAELVRLCILILLSLSASAAGSWEP